MIAAPRWNPALEGFACPVCGRQVAPPDTLHEPVCRTCTQPLVARYSVERVRREQSREALGRNGRDLWRYRAMLP